MDVWQACEAVDVDLTGRACFGGMDLASTQDISAYALYFPPTEDDERHHVLPFFWIPSDNISKRAREYRVPLEAWVEQGYIMATEGNVIDYAFIKSTILVAGMTSSRLDMMIGTQRR